MGTYEDKLIKEPAGIDRLCAAAAGQRCRLCRKQLQPDQLAGDSRRHKL